MPSSGIARVKGWRRLALALCLCAPLAPAAAADCSGRLAVSAFPDGRPLLQVTLKPLAPDRGPGYDFALRYRHSVTLTPVESRYRIEDGRLVQVAELFTDHGPGLASDLAGDGRRWERAEGAFELEMERPLERIVLRVAGAYANELLTADTRYDLTAWGDRALLLETSTCPP